MNPPTILLHFEDELASAQRIAEAASIACIQIERHRFPDGELKLRLPATLPARMVLLRTLANPNEKLVELLLVARTARALGAQHVTLVAPYLAYMRQDIAFRPGEVVSQKVVGQFLAELFDAVVTVDPHLHRIATLNEAIPIPDAVVLSGAPLLADLIASHRPGALLMGPDEESAQWLAQAAARHGFDYGVCHKVRRGDRDVTIALPDVPVAGRNVVLLDDVASSGHTLAGAARLLLAAGASSVDVAVTHALFAGDALDVIRASGVQEVWSTDCIPHASNAISMAIPIAHALTQLYLPETPQ
jgi:ribose-phosphate pyrophosphokinase